MHNVSGGKGVDRQQIICFHLPSYNKVKVSLGKMRTFLLLPMCCFLGTPLALHSICVNGSEWGIPCKVLCILCREYERSPFLILSAPHSSIATCELRCHSLAVLRNTDRQILVCYANSAAVGLSLGPRLHIEPWVFSMMWLTVVGPLKWADLVVP